MAFVLPTFFSRVACSRRASSTVGYMSAEHLANRPSRGLLVTNQATGPEEWRGRDPWGSGVEGQLLEFGKQRESPAAFASRVSAFRPPWA
jgi:hypothetical protein